MFSPYDMPAGQVGVRESSTENDEPVVTERGTLETARGFVPKQLDVKQTEAEKREEEYELMMQKAHKLAQLKLSLEDKVKVSGRYSTLFSGLKLNTEHNTAITQPLLYLLRRVYYAFVIVFMCHMPQVALMTLMVFCVGMLAFTITEKPWKHDDAQKLAVTNEVILYVILVLTTASTSLSRPNSLESDVLGYSIIGMVTLAIHVNLVAMMAQAWHHTKLLYARRAYLRSQKAAMDLKIMPSTDKNSPVKEQEL